jgi:hypothetical protein
MSKKKIIVSISLIFIILFIVVLFSPWKMKLSKFNKDCRNYCEDIKNTPRYGLECKLPLGGCYDGCIGFKISEKCSKRSKCFESCEATCFGLNTSLCAPSIFERKINFLSNKNRE